MVSNPDFELCEVVKWLKTALVKQLDCQEVCFEKEVIKWGAMDTFFYSVYVTPMSLDPWKQWRDSDR